MPGKVIGESFNKGYAGTVSATADAIIQARVAHNDIAFGSPVFLGEENEYHSFSGLRLTKDTVNETFAGIAVREVVQANTFDPQSNFNYLAGQIADVLVRGQCVIKVQKGRPAANLPVYMRITKDNNYPDADVGGFEAFSDSSPDEVNTVLLPNVVFTTGNVDNNGMCEVTIKTRNVG